jgi:2-phosphosulfolactate phosphatase
LAAALPGSRLCGESDGLKVEGFDFGNSPTEFKGLDVRGWTVVQSTSNGTRALALAATAAVTFVGCLRNRTAVARALLAGPGAMAMVCSGEQEATTPSVEDSFTAGAIVEALLKADATVQPLAGARLARRLWRSYRGSARAAFAESAHAAHLQRLGFEDDLRFAAEIDVESVVASAALDGTGRIVVRAPTSSG